MLNSSWRPLHRACLSSCLPIRRRSSACKPMQALGLYAVAWWCLTWAASMLTAGAGGDAAGTAASETAAAEAAAEQPGPAAEAAWSAAGQELDSCLDAINDKCAGSSLLQALQQGQVCCNECGKTISCCHAEFSRRPSRGQALSRISCCSLASDAPRAPSAGVWCMAAVSSGCRQAAPV